MVVMRELSPSIIDLIKGDFVEDGDFTREIMTREYKFMLKNMPDDICVIVSYDDTGTPNGHLVAFKPYNRNYVMLEQAFSRCGKESAEYGFKLLEDWTKSKGFNEIRMETERQSVAARALLNWGFVEHSILMRKIL